MDSDPLLFCDNCGKKDFYCSLTMYFDDLLCDDCYCQALEEKKDD